MKEPSRSAASGAEDKWSRWALAWPPHGLAGPVKSTENTRAMRLPPEAPDTRGGGYP